MPTGGGVRAITEGFLGEVALDLVSKGKNFECVEAEVLGSKCSCTCNNKWFCLGYFIWKRDSENKF